MHILAEISPLDPIPVQQGISIGGNRITTSGNVVTLTRPWDLSRPMLRVSSTQSRDVNGLNGAKWWPAILRKPTINLSLFDGDYSGSTDPGTASFELDVGALEKLDASARRFIWAGAPVTIYAGASGQVWPWTKVFVGRVDNFRLQGNKLSLTVAVDESPFKAKVLSAIYAGTGGLEGGADIKGKPKPWAFGAPKNIEPVLIDSINSVFQVSAYGAIKAVTTLYERGAAFSASFGNYADYTDLVAASIPAGRWATCLASGLIRLGAPPYGVITADIEGDYLSSTWRRLPGAILQRICSALSISGSLIDTASLNALDSALTALPAGGNISLYLTQQQEVIDLAREIAISCNAQAGISWLGQLFTTRVAIGSPVATLDTQQKQMPRVVSNVEIQVSPPYTRIQMGGEKCWRPHSFDEIAFGSELIDKGLYSNSIVYRDGNIVSLDDGSRWLFAGTTPIASSYPTDINTNWSRMTNAVELAYVGSTPATTVEAGANAANNGVNPDGTIKGDRVSTSSIVARNVTDGADVSSLVSISAATAGTFDSSSVLYTCDGGTILVLATLQPCKSAGASLAATAQIFRTIGGVTTAITRAVSVNSFGAASDADQIPFQVLDTPGPGDATYTIRFVRDGGSGTLFYGIENLSVVEFKDQT